MYIRYHTADCTHQHPTFRNFGIKLKCNLLRTCTAWGMEPSRITQKLSIGISHFGCTLSWWKQNVNLDARTSGNPCNWTILLSLLSSKDVSHSLTPHLDESQLEVPSTPSLRKVVSDMSDVLAADPTMPSAGWNRSAAFWHILAMAWRWWSNSQRKNQHEDHRLFGKSEQNTEKYENISWNV